LSLIEALDEKNCLVAQSNFGRWPLLHQLGFIPANCYTQLEMEDGEYSPCDLIPMGVIPTILNDIILQFAKELGTRHTQDTKKEFLNQWQHCFARYP
jgi:hypothetical protein